MGTQVPTRCVPWHRARGDDRLPAMVDRRALAGVAKVLGDKQVKYKAKANWTSTKSGSLHTGGSPTTKAPGCIR